MVTSTIKGFAIALFLTVVIPAHGMFRGGFMTARSAFNKFLSRPSFTRLTPTQGIFTTQSVRFNPWVKRSLIGAAMLPGYVGLYTYKKKLNQYDLEQQKIAYMKELYKQRRKYVRAVYKACPGCPIDIRWTENIEKPKQTSTSHDDIFANLTPLF
jgi:hypothetical protein